MDLNILTADTIDILQHFIPTESEIKAFTSYTNDGRSINNLSDEDRFLYGVGFYFKNVFIWLLFCFSKLSKIERLSQKLNVVSFMANFDEIYQNLMPQLQAVLSASSSLKNNSRFRKILEVIYIDIFSIVFINEWFIFIRLYLLLEIIWTVVNVDLFMVLN